MCVCVCVCVCVCEREDVHCLTINLQYSIVGGGASTGRAMTSLISS